MLTWKLFGFAVALAMCARVGGAETGRGSTSPSTDAGTSSSSASADATSASARVIAVPPPLAVKQNSGRILPFSRLAIGTRIGTLGIGGQIATPITRWLNLRGGVDLFNFAYNFDNSGTNYAATMHLKSGFISGDVYPFHHSSFHLSPGVLIFKSRLNASMMVPGGNSFSENDTDYTSDPADPVNGSGSVLFSRSAMPAFTMGFGNMIRREKHSHWSVPVEVGAAYTGHYTVQLNFAGSVCNSQGCGNVNDPSVQQNIQAEQAKINEKAKHFQIYPILTTGIAYRF